MTKLDHRKRWERNALPLDWRRTRWLLGAALWLMLFPVVRLFWAAAGWEEQWLHRGLSVCLLGVSLLLLRGDWVSRLLMPLLAYRLGGWVWLLLLLAFGRTDALWAGKVIHVAEWLPRRALWVMRVPPQEGGPWPRQRRRRALLVVALLALAVNTTAFLRYAPSAIAHIPFPDSGWYLDGARHILENGEYVVQHPVVIDGPAPSRATRMPLYPLFLAGCRLVGGSAQMWLATALQSGGNALTAVLVFLVAEALLSSSAGLAASLLYLFYWPSARAACWLLTEPFAVPFYTLAMYLVLRAHSTQRGRWWLPAGAALGLSTLIRPNTLLTPCLIVLMSTSWVLASRRGLRLALRPALLVVAFAGMMLPWWVRNAMLFHTFVPASTLAGANAWAGSSLRHKGKPRLSDYQLWTEVYRCAGGNEVLADRILMLMAIQQWRENWHQPLAAVRLVGYKLDQLVLHPEWPNPECGGWPFWHTTLLWAALVGAVSLRRSEGSWLVGVFVFSVVGLHLATYAGEARYFLPLMPLVIAWAGVAAARLFDGVLVKGTIACLQVLYKRRGTATRVSGLPRRTEPGAHTPEPRCFSAR